MANPSRHSGISQPLLGGRLGEGLRKGSSTPAGSDNFYSVIVTEY